jgi:hypothetical protein
MANYSPKLESNKYIPAPELSKEAQLPVHLELDGCEWLDKYVDFNRKWSPRSFDGYYEATGLWLLSTVAARRIVITFGGGKYTNLYLLLVGRSSLFAKSTTVSIAKDFINTVGLSSFLLPDECTPQRMIQEMSSAIPDKFDSFSLEKREKFLKELAFAGQKGWYFDEYGSGLQNMMRREGPYGEFRGIIRKFDDTEPSYIRGTIIRGREEVDRPYLALLGALTPADLAPFASRGSMLWGDGFLARMALIVPHDGIIKDGEFPRGKRIFDESLLRPISDWHKRLGMPKVKVVKGMVERDLKEIKSELDLSKETRSANAKYGKALRKILVDMSLTDLDGNYARFPEKALRISALFASLDGSREIGINHWAKAQAITERWRSSLHSLYKQVNAEAFAVPKWTNTQKVLKVIKERQFPTSREIQQITDLTAPEVDNVLEKLKLENKVIGESVGKTNRYKLSM